MLVLQDVVFLQVALVSGTPDLDVFALVFGIVPIELSRLLLLLLLEDPGRTTGSCRRVSVVERRECYQRHYAQRLDASSDGLL